MLKNALATTALKVIAAKTAKITMLGLTTAKTLRLQKGRIGRLSLEKLLVQTAEQHQLMNSGTTENIFTLITAMSVVEG